MLDLFCAGVKDGVALAMSATDWTDELNKLLPAEDGTAIQPACARNLVRPSPILFRQ